MLNFKLVIFRAPIAFLADGQNLFSAKNVIKYMKDHQKDLDSHFPESGFIAMGSTDENWGWLSTHFLNRTSSWEFDLMTYPPNLPSNGQLNGILPFLDHPKLIMLYVNQHHNVR